MTAGELIAQLQEVPAGTEVALAQVFNPSRQVAGVGFVAVVHAQAGPRRVVLMSSEAAAKLYGETAASLRPQTSEVTHGDGEAGEADVDAEGGRPG